MNLSKESNGGDYTSEEGGGSAMKYKKPRGARACFVCRLRKVRCDAETKMPCTNCVTFGCECKLPESRRKRTSKVKPLKPSVLLTGSLKQSQNHHQTSSPPYSQYAPPQYHYQYDNQQPIYQYDQQIAPQQVQVYMQQPQGLPPQVSRYPAPYVHNGDISISGPQQPYLPNYEMAPASYGQPLPPSTVTTPIIPLGVLQPHIKQEQETLSSPQSKSQDLVPAPSSSPIVKSPLNSTPLSSYYPAKHKDHVIRPYVHHLPGPQLPGPHVNNTSTETNNKANPNDPDDTFFIPNEPILNISTINLTPEFDPNDLEGEKSTTNGIRITRSRHSSEYTYFGPTSCYSYFSGTIQEPNNDLDSFPFPPSSFPEKPSALPRDEQGSQNPSNSGTPQVEPEKLKYQSYTNIDTDEILSELAILNIKQAFYLPSKHISNAIFETYFENVHPHIPIIHKDLFLRRFNDPNPNMRPPLILIQVILLVGSRSCKHPALLDSNGKNMASGQILFHRVKSLYDTSLRFEYIGDLKLEDEGHLFFNYPTILVQVLALLSWYWEGPEDLSRGPFFWLKNAIYNAITFGFHRDPAKTHLSALLASKFKGSTNITQFKIEQQFFFWKKLWWCLFSRDRGVSLSFGRPLNIRVQDGDVGNLTIEDFIKYEPGKWSIDNEKDQIQAEYFIYYVRLAEVLGFVLVENYSIVPFPEFNKLTRNTKAVKHLNMIMGFYFQSLPEYLRYDIHNPKSINMYSCLIGSLYYTVLYHINRVKFVSLKKTEYNKYWGISFQSVYLLSMTAHSLSEQMTAGSVKLLPTQVLYTISLAMILLSLNSLSSNQIVARTSKTQMEVCLGFLRQCHDYWPGITFLLVTFITERLSLGDQSGALVNRAKSLLYDICRRYYFDDSGKVRNPSRLFDINFLLNSTENNNESAAKEGDETKTLTDKGEDNDFGWNPAVDADDPSLPIYNLRTFRPPGVDSEFYKTFDITMLFSSTKSQIPPGLEFEAMNGTEEPEHEDEGVYHNTYRGNDTDYANSAEFAGPKPETDKTPDKASQNSRITLLDNQYFLNVTSGVDWDAFNM